MNKTKIPWVKCVDNKTQGFTVNPMTGCLGPDDKGPCPYCYAKRESDGRCHKRDLEGKSIEVGHEGESFYPRLHFRRLSDLLSAPKGAGVFVCDRSDWAAPYWPEWCQRELLHIAVRRPDIRLYLLTKQPEQLLKFSPFPPNCYVGVSATNQQQWLDAQCKLDFIKAKVKFVSIEPLLEHILISSYDLKGYGGPIDWLILGSQTKPTLHPPAGAVEEIISAADKAGIPVFVKPPLSEYLGINRQEMPEVKAL